ARARAPAAPRSGSRASSLHLDPALLLRRTRDRLAEEDLLVPVGESREVGLGWHASLLDGRVHGPVELLERVREPLGVAGGVVGEAARVRIDQRRVAREKLVRPVAVA